MVGISVKPYSGAERAPRIAYACSFRVAQKLMVMNLRLEIDHVKLVGIFFKEIA